MRIAFLFHKDPLEPAASIDLVRLGALSAGLRRLGADVSIVAPVRATVRTPVRATVRAPVRVTMRAGGARLGPVPVLPLDVLGEKGRFDILKACYHFSLELLGGYDGPLLCRLVRVVDERLPERDAAFRQRLLACQEIAARRAQGIVFNNRENILRWRERHGTRQRVALLPTGCPSRLPPLEDTPYPAGPPPLLFLGSLASPRMADLLGDLAGRLRGQAEIHFVGKNKTSLYGPGEAPLPPGIVAHGEMEEDRMWTYARWARLGLALAAGPDVFDNDLSKIVAYLRAGLPVLAEERLANSRLFTRWGFGKVFRYGDPADMAEQARSLLTSDVGKDKGAVMAWMASRHSWERRAQTLLALCRRVVGDSP